MTSQETLLCIRGWSQNAEEWAGYLKQILAYHVDRSHQLGLRYCDANSADVAIWHKRQPLREGRDVLAIEPTVKWMCHRMTRSSESALNS